MITAPYNCPSCTRVLMFDQATKIGQVELRLYSCINKDYSCIERSNKKFSEMFINNNIVISVFYENGVYEKHFIWFTSGENNSIKTEVSLNDENFQAVFSRNNLHPLLEKIEKYEVFS